MKILITPDVRIALGEGTNWQIERRLVVESGKHVGEERWLAIGYHGTLKSAIESLFTRHMDLLIDRPEKVTSLRALARAISEAEQRIISAIEATAASSTA